MEAVKGILGGEWDFGRKKCKVEGQRRARDWVVVSFVTRDNISEYFCVDICESTAECEESKIGLYEHCDVDLGRRRWRRGRSIEERQG